MPNVSIYQKKWLDLVFEGKNQAYGAYQLRTENPRTTLISLFLGVSIFALLLIPLMITNSVREIPPAIIEDWDRIIKVENVIFPKPDIPEPKVLPAVAGKIEDNPKENLDNAIIVRNDENPVDVMTNQESIENPSENTGVTEGDGNSNVTDSDASGQGISSGTDTEETIMTSVALDKLPEFPGGINKFLKYVGNNFRQPDFSNTNVDGSKAIKVLMSFVIEKDGSITDIKVLRNPGYGLDKEAIRVLKSQKTKWKPGIKNGKPVRTLYTLPISIVPQ